MQILIEQLRNCYNTEHPLSALGYPPPVPRRLLSSPGLGVNAVARALQSTALHAGFQLPNWTTEETPVSAEETPGGLDTADGDFYRGAGGGAVAPTPNRVVCQGVTGGDRYRIACCVAKMIRLRRCTDSVRETPSVVRCISG